MSAGRGSGAAGGGGVLPVPAGSRMVVQSLKEIVNCPEAEIYATLKDCNMDPNEAISRLLSQDTFHEVKSKREKKKEGKDSSESRPRGANNSSNRASKSAADRHLSRGSSASQYNASEPPLHGKSTNKKENGSTYRSSSSSAPGISGNTRSREQSGFSVGASAENKGSWFQTGNGTSSVVQPPSGHQSAWTAGGVTGQVSMADIVRMGRPHSKAPNASHHNIQDQWEASSGQPVPTTEDWPSIEKPAPTNLISIPEYSVDSELHAEASGLSSDSINHQSEADEMRKIDDTIDGGFVSMSSRKIPEDVPRGASVFEDDLFKKTVGSYQSEGRDFEYHEKAHEFEHHERDPEFKHHERDPEFEHHERDPEFEHHEEEVGASVSSAARNLQQLSVTKENRGFSYVGNAPSVVIPDHLQVQIADCSHLSFGSFGAAKPSGTTTSMLVKNNLEEAHREADISTAEHLDTRRSEYYVDDARTNAPDGSLFGRNGASGENYDVSSASQRDELLKPESAQLTHGSQYAFPSNAGYTTFDDAQHLHAALNQRSSQMQNVAPFSNVMHSHTNSLPGSLLNANVQPTRESDLHYSPFSATQSMSAKYGNAVSSMGVSALPMPEALKTVGLSSSQPGQQAISGHALPQQVALHPQYSQTNLPMGQFPNMMGYPFLPQSYTYMPSAFQQSLAGSSAYHQSLAALLPQYKSSASSISSLPQSASGYGGFGNNTSIPGNYQMNPQSAAPLSESALSYDDVLNAQYKERSHLLSLQQQSENSPVWLQGHNSRTMSGVPASTIYNLQAQQTNQQLGGFRQGQAPHQQQQQQQSQNYGNPNYYHSQTGMSLDQLQNPRDVSGSQGQPKQSQMWPNNY
ncbi:hypothetical protein ABFS83_08G129800 [Erythranthe nasuta]